MPHTYECPLRWADLDLLGHVNNVTYLDYVTEARHAFLEGLPAAGASIDTHRVQFVRPLMFRREPVLVDTWVTSWGPGAVHLAHEVYDTLEGERTVYLRVSSVLAHEAEETERERLASYAGEDHTWPPLGDEPRHRHDDYTVVVRRSDLDGAGLVRDAVFFEYTQEARIRYVMGLHTRGEKWTQHVIARTDIDYLAPMPHRTEPYAVRSWIAHLGSRSFTIRSEVLDGDTVLARAAVVMVTFDLETQGTVEMAPEQRARLERELGRTEGS